MRNTGIRYECLRLRPHDHIGWVFQGAGQFAALAGPFLAEGAVGGACLMYVAEDPGQPVLSGIPGLPDPAAVQIASIADVYGPSGVVDAARQRATFEAALDAALAAGFTGIRVAADNSPLVADDERLAAWIRWEVMADQLMSERPITGLCAFDRTKVDVDRLRHLATLHPLSSAGQPMPQFRLFSEAGRLRAEGELDVSAIGELWSALRLLPAKTGVVVDLATASFLSATALGALGRIAEAGFDVIVRGPRASLERLALAGTGVIIQTA